MMRATSIMLLTMTLVGVCRGDEISLRADPTAAPPVLEGFKTLGAMIDVSRGRVLKVDYLKGRFARCGSTPFRGWTRFLISQPCPPKSEAYPIMVGI